MNYIIATYPGKNASRSADPYSEITLSLQLQILRDIISKKRENGIECMIKGITIVETVSKTGKKFENYYQFETWKTWFPGINFTILKYQGANEHYSYDQWLQGMLANEDAGYTHHILMEDDYCIHPDCIDFDTSLLKIYGETFPNDIGYLCQYADAYKSKYHHAVISNGMISTATIALIPGILQEFYKYKQSAQISFSLLFTDRSIPIKDYRNHYKIYFWRSPNQSLVDFTQNVNVERNCIIPIQMTNLLKTFADN